jgi:hypothetical protein
VCWFFFYFYFFFLYFVANKHFSCRWIWKDDWHIDLTRAVDANGWEYAFDFDSAYLPLKKRKHFVRRRRWIRTRIRDPNMNRDDFVVQLPERDPDGWEYATDFGKVFHGVKLRSDCVRRRRWHRDARQGEWRPTPALAAPAASNSSSSLVPASQSEVGAATIADDTVSTSEMLEPGVFPPLTVCTFNLMSTKVLLFLIFHFFVLRLRTWRRLLQWASFLCIAEATSISCARICTRHATSWAKIPVGFRIRTSR